MLAKASLAALAVASAAAASPSSQEVSFGGFGTYIEGAVVDNTGNIYAVHFRGSTDETFFGNLENRNTLGVVDAVTGEASSYFKGLEGSVFKGMQWDPVGGALYLADKGRARVVKVDLATMESVDHCGADGSLVGTGAPRDLAFAETGAIYLSGQDWFASSGGLWLCRQDGTVTKLDSMYRTKGIALSRDGSMLYLTEAVGSPVLQNDKENRQVIWRYVVDVASGEVSGKTKFYDFGADPSKPEAMVDSNGMQMDAEGNLWVTRHGAGKVAVIAPSGALMQEVQLLKTTWPTSLAFGGPNGETLFVVGRCGNALVGTGSGCIEAVAASGNWASAPRSATCASPIAHGDTHSGTAPCPGCLMTTGICWSLAPFNSESYCMQWPQNEWCGA